MNGRVLALARSTSVRVVVALCGVAGSLLILRGLGWATIGMALVSAAGYLPLLIALDACVVACSMLALRSLYGDAARAIPMSQLVRAGLVGYAVQGLVPAGRAVAEVTRASQLARWVGAGTAAAAATRMQAVVLVAGGAISIPTAIAAYRATGPSWIPLAIAIHGVVAFAIGGALLGVASRSTIGAWLGRRVSRARSFGNELDAALAGTPAIPIRAIAWELAGRCVQVVQNENILYAANRETPDGLPEPATRVDTTQNSANADEQSSAKVSVDAIPSLSAAWTVKSSSWPPPSPQVRPEQTPPKSKSRRCQ